VARIARVEPLVTARAVRGPFDYRIPSAMEKDVGVGSVLLVPFGRRRLLGVVVEVASDTDLPPERLVEPLRALESGVPAGLASLALWISESYCSTPARALALVLPPGTGTGSRAVPAARTRQLLVAELTDTGRAAVAGDGTRLTQKQRAVLESLRNGPLTAAESGADHPSLRRLGARGLLTLSARTHQRRPEAMAVGGKTGAGALLALTRSQERALAPVLTALGDRRNESFLLHGVTGSGKTEVYLRAAAAALEQGRSAIVLVPEIALTPQTARRFRERFGDGVAILHSQLGLGERYDEWQRLRRGEARVCVGPRSAVFAPAHDVGLIVVDEEHDSAYKQEQDPRYDARRVAQRRAERSGAVLLAGTATPRPESWLRMRRLDLPERVDALSLPPVELVDMREVRHTLHRRTREALDEVKRRGAKAIVLVGRRGWSPFLVCRTCGWAWTCPRCDVTLTLHRGEEGERLLCHHCGHFEQPPTVCPDCTSTAVARHGTGTQRLEAELREALSPFPVFRLDGDAARRKHGVARILQQFEEADAGVLVGTQMVAQGHDFPEVELAVVQDADATLRFPDFRSEERTFSLVAQLAGRSGRGPGGGRVLVQTLSPEMPCLRHAARHDAASFLEEELERRRLLSYPPFADLIRIVTAAPVQADADAAAEAIRGRLSSTPLEALGPAPLFRIKDRCRSMLLLKTVRRDTAVGDVGAAVQEIAGSKMARATTFSVDVDPQ
jgi:primosomal protein N' (replication factor Y)